jgi:hypothetical protein
MQLRAIEQAWYDVDRLLRRGADPNRQFDLSRNDGKDHSLLHRAIEACEWRTVKNLIQFHADLNKPEPVCSETPLQMLIDLNRTDLIDEASQITMKRLKNVLKRFNWFE